MKVTTPAVTAVTAVTAETAKDRETTRTMQESDINTRKTHDGGRQPEETQGCST